LTNDVAVNMGILGVAGRASGIAQDTRQDYPYAGYEAVSLGEVPVELAGDVQARFQIRVEEVMVSLHCITTVLQTLPTGKNRADVTAPVVLKKNALALSVVEGWRGEILYFVTTDDKGRVNRVFPRDPSFVNWSALPSAGFDNVIPDFPLINKSFSLSYSGNDL